ncbi:hypothetical protein FGA82_31225 [Pseudomonas fluorescens]|uniref:hypothetical protein n=1 Tax=Pseudomonas fluorescens TaxID=294 RepID=UPI001131834A|nr:hypothetical protein [Pseudomonas fluorescens]TMU66285.1 hypothetical protein FGA82_31225 [Pseudomonas fluorescens]
MLLSKTEISNHTNRLRPDQSLDSTFDILSMMISIGIVFNYSGSPSSSEPDILFDSKTLIVNQNTTQKIRAQSLFNMAYISAAAITFKDKTHIQINIKNNKILTKIINNPAITPQQATETLNHFASSILMPEKLTQRVITQLMSNFDIKDRNHGKIYVDYQECNHRDFVRIINNTCSIFDVSAEIAINRLTELGILKDIRVIRPANWSTFIDTPNANNPLRVHIELTNKFNPNKSN